jgi:methionyl-tRNA formyltransferase
MVLPVAKGLSLMRIVFLGTGDFAVPALRALSRTGHRVAMVIGQPDRPTGRGRRIRPTPVHAAADELGLPHLQVEDVNAEDVRGALGEAEIGVVAAFGQKIGRAVLDTMPHGCVNIHASLLPKYRGAAPYQWAIINGEETTGVTVFQLNEGWDAGPIWCQRETAIGEGESADELHDRLAALGAELIVETLSLIERGEAKPRAQDPSQATRARKLTRADATVDWLQPAGTIVRRIHGLWSWPAATCLFSSHRGKRERLQLARAEVADQTAAPTTDLPAGAFHPDGTVQTGTGRVRLREVKPQGGKLMSFEAFAHGRHVQPPDRLLPLESP